MMECGRRSTEVERGPVSLALVTESRWVFGGVGVFLFVCFLGLVVAVCLVCFLVFWSLFGCFWFCFDFLRVAGEFCDDHTQVAISSLGLPMSPRSAAAREQNKQQASY